MKNSLGISLAILVSVTVAAGQDFSQPSAYSANDIQVLGTLNNGQTSRLVAGTSGPKYRAFVFEGNGHDRVEITTVGANHNALIALADSTLSPVASGVGRLSATLPDHGPDTEVFYILVKPNSNQAGSISVHFMQAPGAGQAGDAGAKR